MSASIRTSQTQRDGARVPVAKDIDGDFACDSGNVQPFTSRTLLRKLRSIETLLREESLSSGAWRALPRSPETRTRCTLRDAIARTFGFCIASVDLNRPLCDCMATTPGANPVEEDRGGVGRDL
jgi:hypothetical protein